MYKLCLCLLFSLFIWFLGSFLPYTISIKMPLFNKNLISLHYKAQKNKAAIAFVKTIVALTILFK